MYTIHKTKSFANLDILLDDGNNDSPYVNDNSTKNNINKDLQSYKLMIKQFNLTIGSKQLYDNLQKKEF